MNELLRVEKLTVDLEADKGNISLVKNVSFSLKEGKCLGILGESGSGKSMTCKAIMGLLDRNFKTGGKISYRDMDMLVEDREKVRKLRGKEIAAVLQNPMTCFDPLYTIEKQMAETFLEHTDISSKEVKKLSVKALESMNLKDPEDILKKYPHQLSGGMLQRIMIGLALAMNPKLIIADEPTTAIDAVNQYEIMKIFQEIKENHRVGMIFISHDLGVISAIADEVIVMNKGEVVSQGSREEVFSAKKNDYTQMLIEKKQTVARRYREILEGRKGEGDAFRS